MLVLNEINAILRHVKILLFPFRAVHNVGYVPLASQNPYPIPHYSHSLF